MVKIGSILIAMSLSVQAMAYPTIIVSKKFQSYSIIENGLILKKGSVSTGKKGYPTPSGTFKIHTKMNQAYSYKYKAPMNYALFFKSYRYALHSGIVPGYPASHGCVRVPKSDAQSIYHLLTVGSTVIIK